VILVELLVGVEREAELVGAAAWGLYVGTFVGLFGGVHEWICEQAHVSCAGLLSLYTLLHSPERRVCVRAHTWPIDRPPAHPHHTPLHSAAARTALGREQEGLLVAQPVDLRIGRPIGGVGGADTHVARFVDVLLELLAPAARDAPQVDARVLFVFRILKASEDVQLGLGRLLD
jgi:hypothetical protein